MFSLILDWDIPYPLQIVVGALVLSRLFVDTYYFLRVGWATVFSVVKLALGKKLNLLDEYSYKVRCMPTDLDHMQHMNNSRYNRECDFSRFYLLFMNGLFRAIYFNKFKVGLAGTTIRFRRSIEFLVTAILSSKVVYWDERSIYIEQTFSRPSDSFVYAIMYAKYTIVHGTVAELLDCYGYEGEKPELSPDLNAWIEYNRLSSEKLRPKTS